MNLLDQVTNYETINVAEQLQDSGSIFNFYRQLIALRKAEPALIYGSYDLVLETHQQIYAYTRTLNEQKLLIICNLTKEPAQYIYDNGIQGFEDLLLSNYPKGHSNNFQLSPFEARVYRLSKD